MATGLLEIGPKLNWTRDNKIFDRYQIWKEKVELIFSSALEESSSKQKVSYLRYWMGEQGIPLVKKWTALGKLDFSSSEEDALSSGYILQIYWNLVKVCPWCGVGLLHIYFLYCGVLNKLTLLLVSAAPVKRKGARGEVRFPRRPRYYVSCSI